MIKEPQAGQVVPVGYPVPRRAMLAGTVAAGVLAWAHRPAGPSLAANPADPRNLLAACMVWQASRRGLATYVPFDEGSTWHRNGLLPGVTRVGRRPRRRAARPGMPVAHRRWRAKLHHAGDRGHRPARPPVARRRPVGPLRPRHLVRRGRLLRPAAP